MFLPGRPVMPGGAGSAEFASMRAAGASPLARRLLALDGVRSAFFGADFVTVTKDPGVAWPVLRPEVFEVVADFFASGEPVLTPTADGEGGGGGGGGAGPADTAILDTDSEVVAMIKELIETRVKGEATEAVERESDKALSAMEKKLADAGILRS
ncbi:hypothetical protein BU14_1364s0002 [Porphyra umbilicalis]|uniref:Scaffold protein Nfu/NifU N-terminal domain-containing protein n=1 Tax=Porphyra umbilicalis TaxID=2786 RepID=A0A1X6NML5_PORUM|nr:hypothetical protein BU14_1364s0002 [Porphyra umbilicalis]|eukprot:OSX69593.1 hypothetical protein BU14_1364s0002 [Porphyra umbilicalis]